eukprot:NODE_3571_length_2017_cov_4.856614.p8 GENE.NODE_3571_length_2017_cov_4.856614~~NODE_3571_length_2017_cov_4.856614.p8  ORF type:complete len:84 (+),score=21.37 NODE_3571_length_2017_cov_4.856614:395-646(+)
MPSSSAETAVVVRDTHLDPHAPRLPLSPSLCPCIVSDAPSGMEVVGTDDTHDEEGVTALPPEAAIVCQVVEVTRENSGESFDV